MRLLLNSSAGSDFKSDGYTTVDTLEMLVYNTSIVQQHKGGTVKAADLLRKLQKNGAVFKRHGSGHDIWERNGKSAPVPRHRTIKESTARAILKELGIPL